MPGSDAPAMPDSWVKDGSKLYCLACQRERAAEAVLKDLPKDAPIDRKLKLSSFARVEFELRRDPDLPDSKIAKACRTSMAAVRKGREELGIPAPKLTKARG
jgi:hypothetical protein